MASCLSLLVKVETYFEMSDEGCFKSVGHFNLFIPKTRKYIFILKMHIPSHLGQWSII